MDYNTPDARQSLTREDAFGPLLENDTNFVLTSPCTYVYNCIAFAMGVQDRWVDTANLPWHWWPPIKKGNGDLDLIEAFKFVGFEVCGMDDSIEEEFDKVALYHNKEGWTHAAKVVSPGVYHSKFGASYDGTHSNGNVLSSQYGDVYTIMKRLKRKSYLSSSLMGETPGEIHSNVVIQIGETKDHIVTYRGKTYLSESGHEVRIVGTKIEIV